MQPLHILPLISRTRWSVLRSSVLEPHLLWLTALSARSLCRILSFTCLTWLVKVMFQSNFTPRNFGVSFLLICWPFSTRCPSHFDSLFQFEKRMYSVLAAFSSILHFLAHCSIFPIVNCMSLSHSFGSSCCNVPIPPSHQQIDWPLLLVLGLWLCHLWTVKSFGESTPPWGTPCLKLFLGLID